MSGIQWTAEQERAIGARGKHILVSAAAGSGKTAVLVERIVRRVIDEKGEIDRLLVVTFTDAAAAQMRDRLVQRIHEALAVRPDDAHLLRQLLLLPGASISTLHAFCLKVVRQHFYRLGLDPAFRVLDEHEAQLLRLESLDGAMESLYETMHPDGSFARLVTAYGGADGDEALQRFILNMHDYSRSLPDPAGWLKECGRRFRHLSVDEFDASPWAEELQRLVLARIGRAEGLLRRALAVAEGPGGSPNHAQTYEEDLERLEQLRVAAQGPWSTFAMQGELCTFGRLQAARGDGSDPEVNKRGTALRKRALDYVKKHIHDALLSRPLEQEIETLRALAGPMEALVQCVSRLDEEYSAAKNERGLIDFGDIEHLCLQLLAVPEVAEEVAGRFDEVLVDECQDLNGVQDAILERIAPAPEKGGELFMVGDVKQSVYRFRQADPGLFLGRYRRARSDEDAAEMRIDLQSNFRSRQGVVDGVNFLFRQLMTEDAGEMDYGPDAELVAGARFADGGDEPPVEFHVLERDRRLLVDEVDADEDVDAEEGAGAPEEEDGEDLSAFQREARWAAQHLLRLVREGNARVWDKAAGGYRPVRWGDIVILLRVTRHRANELVEELQAAGVPAYAELGTGYFAATEVETMLALLRVLDNPRQDIPLAAVLRSLFGLTPEQLARLRLFHRRGDLYDAVLAAAEAAGPEEADGNAETGLSPELSEAMGAFVAKIDEWRTLARRAPLSKVVWRLLTETRYFDYVGALPGGRQRQANLRALYERARQFNHFSRHGLSRFLRFIERLQDADGDLGTAPAVSEADDVVRIMSVHKSKGLEFPVVYVLDAGRLFQAGAGLRRHPDLAFHRDLGLGPGVVDGERRLAQPSLLLEAVRWRRRREELAEEMRVLYVALTRAKERLIIVGSVRDVDGAAADWAGVAGHSGWPLQDERLLTAAGWMDWVGPAVLRHRDGEPLRERAEEQGGIPVSPADGAVAGDKSRWSVHVHRRLAAGTDQEEEGAEPPLPWALVAKLQPLPEEEAGSGSRKAAEEVAAAGESSAEEGTGQGWAAERGAAAEPSAEERAMEAAAPAREVEGLMKSLAWHYPHRALVGRAAKQSVSELKRRWDALDGGEAAPVTRFRRRLDDRPAFLHAAGRALTAAEKGSAVHLVLQHVDLTAPLDEGDVADQVLDLVRRQMLTEEQAEAVEAVALADFFASDLGRRLRAAGAAGAVQREVPFTMTLPAAEAYPDLDPEAARDETVIVQGIIDCLVHGEEGLLLIDFKTDRVPKGRLQAAAAGYRAQVELYARAVKRMYGRPVAEAYLVFLTAGEAVRVAL